MIDFHYSDRWADPVQQAKPKAWENYTVEELEQAIADHTKDILGAIKEMGIDVEWVQVGNETHQGMLFPTGQTTSSDGIKNFAKFINSGYNAVKEIYPNAKVIVHLDQHNNSYKDVYGANSTTYYFGNSGYRMNNKMNSVVSPFMRCA